MTPEQQKKCNEKLDRGLVRERSQAGRSLSYIEGHAVMRRLNEIFGNGGWSYRCTTREVYRECVDEGPKGKRWHVSYSSSCELRIGDCAIVDVGHGHGIDRSCGIAIESAEKEAATDSLKRCAKSLGDSLGLALYDKEQANVADARNAEIDDAVMEVLGLLKAATSKQDIVSARAIYERTVGTKATAEHREAVRVAAREADKRIAVKAA